MSVPLDILLMAYRRYRELSGLARNQNALRKFITEYLELPEDTVLSTDEITGTALERVKWITGPHAEALYKAWRAQQRG